MAESMCSSFASLDAERDVPRAVEFKTMEKEEFFIDEQVKVHFQFPDEAHCPNYLDVVRILPVNSYTALVDAASGCGDTNGGQLSKMSSSLAASKTDDDFETLNSSVLSGALTFSYCQWKVESAPGLFSVSAEVSALIKENKNNSDEGTLYVAQYITPSRFHPVAESDTFRIFPVTEECMIELPGVFSDDGLIVLGTGSDTDEPELVENDELGNDGGVVEDLTIVLSATELRKMEDEQRTSNDKLRSFIDQYKDDLMELTRLNETLKQKLSNEQEKVENLFKERRRLGDEISELKRIMSHQQTLFQKALTERERQLREEQKKSSKLEEEHSLVSTHLENLRCCVDAHLETKNILVQEIERLKKENEDMAQERKAIKNVEKKDKATETLSDFELRTEKSTAHNSQTVDLEERVQDLIARLQSAKLEYISLYKENKRKEKALENICNWASLAKDGMSLEAPAPTTQVPSLVSHSKSKFGTTSASFDELAHFPMADPSSAPKSATLPSSTLSSNNNSSLANLKAKESKDAQESVEEDLIELGSDSGRLSLPPRQKRKIELVRRTASTAAATAGATSGAALRALRGKMVVRGRHRAQEALRSLKRDLSSLEPDNGSSGQQQQQTAQQQQRQQQPSVLPQQQQQQSKQQSVLSGTSASSNVLPLAPLPMKPISPPRPKAPSKKKEIVTSKPSAPEEPFSNASAVPRSTNTYSAAGLISDLETDASNTEEETSVTNPHICPLCVTSILDYEAHMREAHQKQPCPICGYVFDTNIPLYVMTYHVERHLEEDKHDGSTTASQ
ncbi:protein suppressor 2 of zeste-like isoform X2 [Varroa jacobsoni]|uniref:protein suppressor 2 of zeste-like isoform X2 n=1 Tax=Varroa jacobsoni TaxID=62625 RepID=UPI000BF86229|nr:protein suppressor 2 of zeste-like isoform X2 [Varroa jacobsoni]